MIYKSFAAGGKEHSLLGFGAMRLPTNEDGTIDAAEATRMMEQAITGGVDYFDTGYTYHDGKSELFLKSFFAGRERSSYRLADKLPLWKIEQLADAERIFDEQLHKCGVQYFDCYLAHAVDRVGVKKLRELGLVDFLLRKKAEGYIGELGFSFHDDVDCLREATQLCDWDFCQLQLNYADWNRFDAAKFYAVAEEKRLPIIVMEPVRGGLLADPPAEVAAVLQQANPTRSAASWALRFVASLPLVKLVLSGMSTQNQVADNLCTFADTSVYLSEAEQQVVRQATAVLDDIHSVPCTGCRYCMPCPAGVDIPGVFRCSNTAHFLRTGDGGYKQLPPEQQAPKCVRCGACVALCPQHLDIPELLAQAHAQLCPNK